LSLSPPDGINTAAPDEKQAVTAKEFRSNMR